MTEAQLVTALNTLFSTRVYPDVAPSGVALPYCTWQQVGGVPVNYLGAESTDKKNARVQINVWAATRSQANTLMRQVEDLMVLSPVLATVESGAIAFYDDAVPIRGMHQDFGVWLS